MIIIEKEGRIKKKEEMMDEIEKIVRVLGKKEKEEKKKVIKKIEEKKGKKEINKVEILKKVEGVKGIVMKKMEGKERGGIMVEI